MSNNPIDKINKELAKPKKTVDIASVLADLDVDVLSFCSVRGNILRLYKIFKDAYEMDDLDVGSYANFTKHVKKFRELKERHKRNMAFNKPIKAKKRSKTKIIMTPELKNRELPKNGKVKIAKAKKKGEIKNISGKSISRKKPL